MTQTFYRQIAGLSWAKWCEREMPKRRLKGNRAKGMTYERGAKKHLARLLPKIFGDCRLLDGAWIAYEDRNGNGFAQPDLIVELPSSTIIVEIKLTQTDAVIKQLLGLYLPLVKRLIPDKPVYLVQICKNLRYVPKEGLLSSIDEVLSKQPEEIWTQHFII